MQIREGPARRPAPSAAGALRSPMSAMMLAMFATMASFYVAGRFNAEETRRRKRHCGTFHSWKKDDHIESDEELPKKTKSFFANAAETFDAEFYAKVNDDIYINVDTLSAMLETHWDKPRVYIGCMKSGEVFSDSTHKWYEPDWWKFGDGKSYFRHASGEMFVISRAVAQFISINRSVLRTYAHDDVSVGSWMIGLAVKHVNEAKLCCSSWPS
ncbi:Hydroxyproline O-galactosyltransferase HPGT1, partial [Dichanthelium oligosanthes]